MTLLEYAEKTSTIPLTAWQKEFLTMYEQAKKDGTELNYTPCRVNGRQMVKDIVNQYYNGELKEIRCQKCNKLLGKLPLNTPHEIVCPKCKAISRR